MPYSDYKAKASSEKLTLATVDASKRLMGWTLHSGSIYKLENFDFLVIASLKDSGTAYTEVSSLGSVVASSYYLDRDNSILYLRTTDSDNPNGRILVAALRLYFANAPITLPHDLATGFEVYWEPMIQSTSSFGVEVDTVNQTSEAIEGSGTLTLNNDQSFWPSKFDKLYFENGNVRIYSFNRNLDVSEVKLLFKGKVERKTYSTSSVSFSLKDQVSELRAPVAIATIEELGLRTGSDVNRAKQRLVLGRVFGHVPVNTDQVLDGYPITGTVSVAYNSASLTGVGTSFLSELSPDDRLILGGVEYTVATVTSDTAATITENYANADGLSGASVEVLPDQPKRWINRTWNLAGHALREPVTSTQFGSTIQRLYVDDISDLYPGDWIYIGTLGSGDLVQVDYTVGSHIIQLRSTLETVPDPGTEVRRPCVQNVRINDTLLTFYRDYTVDADTATLTLTDTAEANAAPIRHLTASLTFTSGSRTVTGTSLKSTIKPGYMVGVVGNADFFEVLSVDSDTQLSLRTNATFTTTATGRYKHLIFDPSEDVLTVDVLGKTEDGTTQGTLLKTAPRIVKSLLTDLGLSADIDEDAFTEAENVVDMHIGLVYPSKYSDTNSPTYRDVINDVNKSVFGSLIQDNDFKFSYKILEPDKPNTTLKLSESDILDFKFDSTSEKLVKTSIVEYRKREYDYLSGQEAISTAQTTSETATYVIGSTREQTFSTSLVEESDAQIVANMWAFILEHGAGRATITTKLQAIDLEVGSVIEITHRKFFERIGISQQSRLFLCEAVKKSGSEVTLEVVDLSNAFSRCANYTDSTDDYSDASDNDKLYGGYFTDDYGLIDNDPDSFGSNLYW